MSFCRRRSRIRVRAARFRLRTISCTPMLRTSARNAAMSYGSSSSAGGPSWGFGNYPKSECCASASTPTTALLPQFFFPRSRELSDSRLLNDGRLFDDRLEVPFVYQPRTRAPQPILSLPFPFLSTVKSSPEEWFQITSTIAPKDNSEVEPIDCHVSEQTEASNQRNGA